MASPDLLIENHGSVFLLYSMSELGDEWIAENLDDQAMSYGDAIVVEHRYIEDIAEGAMIDGLVVA